MVTAGVDLSSQAAGTAVCVIEWADTRATVVHLALAATDDVICEWIGMVDKQGIDIPLNWPVAFADAVAQHSRDGTWPRDYRHAETKAYRYRRTDLWVRRNLKTSPPLSVSTDRIALPAMRAAALMSRLPERTALDGSGVVVEVYPAAALRRWGFPSRSYKRKENVEARRQLVEQFLTETAGWLSIGEEDVALCLSSDDAFDAVIGALAAQAAAVGLADGIPDEERTAAAREGWIAVPCEGSLGRLSMPILASTAARGEGAPVRGRRRVRSKRSYAT